MKVVNNLDLNNNQLVNIRLENFSGDIDSGLRIGRLWFDINNNCIKIIDNSKNYCQILDSNNYKDFLVSETITELPHLTITDETVSTSSSTGALIVKGGMGVAGAINADSISGAVWNDYAEYREALNPVEPGYCVCEIGNGRVIKSSHRLQKLPMIVSDTFGFSIGKINEEDVPVAVCGRVLAYTDKPVSKFKIGDWVCAGKDGKITKMNFFEKIFFADRRVGIVSSYPQEKTWGTGKVSNVGRIWIKV